MSTKSNTQPDPYWISFEKDVTNIPLPEKFTFPFYYTPHELSLIAAEELQQNIIEQKNWDHNFGLPNDPDGLIIGKMFGVLVVQNKQGNLGYIAAFSGKIANSNQHDPFVPPVFDLLKQDGFFLNDEKEINTISDKLEKLEKSDVLATLKNRFVNVKKRIDKEKKQLQATLKENKENRKKIRENFDQMSLNDQREQDEKLRQESMHDSFTLRDFQRAAKKEIQDAEQAITDFHEKVKATKQKRKFLSQKLQKKIFEHYHFDNAKGDTESLTTIFEQTPQQTPPSGAGECAAPKLLQYAYDKNYAPIALAEFWWGASPKSEIRKHRNFYPSCRSKCEPILGHMLKGLDVDENPILKNPAEGRALEIAYEDEAIIIVNKPPEFLSVPGKNIKDSVMTRIQEMCPEITGPVIVHRLDMSTSGVMVIAKNEEAHYALQQQFIKRKVKKRYIALLESETTEKKGSIELPLRVDLDNRPHQLVCYEHGKPALTYWEKIKDINGQTLIAFYPVTGRTHQLRVHAAHTEGLNNPIVGDDLYGVKGERLHLHAAYIKFKHPLTGRNFRYEIKSGFEDNL